MAIKVKQIFDTDTLAEVIEKLNFNFDQVVLNGGGLRGFQGLTGMTGITGATGRSGAQIHTGIYPPLNDAASLQVIKDNIINIQIGDYYLYVGADSVIDGYYLGDLYQIVETSGLIPGFTDFELQFKANIRGPEGSDAAALGLIPSYISSQNERFTKRNTGNTDFNIPLRPINKIKPFMPLDVRLNIQNRDLIDGSAEPYLNDNPASVILYESFKTLDIGGQPFGVEGISIDFVIEDPEFDELGLTSSQIMTSRKATIQYEYTEVDFAYTLNIRNDYESEGSSTNPSQFPALKGNILMESSRTGDMELNYGTNFLLDINDDLYGDTSGYDGQILTRSKRRTIVRNEVSTTLPNQFIRLENFNLGINPTRATAQFELRDRNIQLDTLPAGSPSQNINSEPSNIRINSDYILHSAPTGTSYNYLQNVMAKGGEKFYTMIDQDGSNNFVVFKTTRKLGTKGVYGSADNNSVDDYFLMSSMNTGDVFIKGGRATSSSVTRNTRAQFFEDGINLRRITDPSETVASGNNSARVPYISFEREGLGRALLIGWGTNAAWGQPNYTEIRTENNYSLYFNLANGAKAGFESNPLTQTYKYAFANGSVSISNTSTNGALRGLFLTETTADQRGFSAIYNPASNEDYFSIRRNNDGSNWINALSIRRGSGNLGIQLADPNEANLDVTIGAENIGLNYDPSNGLSIRQNASSNNAIILGSIGDIILDMDTNDNDNSAGDKKIAIRSAGREHARFTDEPTGSLTGRSEGHLHFVGNSGDANSAEYTSGITFGHGSDTNSNQGGQAGFFVRSGGSFGTRIDLMTSNSFATGRNKRVTIDQNGNVDIVSGNTLTIGKAGGTESFIRFDAQSNDPGYIRHYESSNTSDMTFVVSDDLSNLDTYTWKGSDEADAMKLDTQGVLTLRSSFSSGGNLSVSGNITANTANTTGRGFVLSDDGGIYDQNNGYASMQFSSGVIITADKNSTTTRHLLNSDGNYYMYNSGSIISPQNQTGSITAYFTGSHGGNGGGNGYSNSRDSNPIYTIGPGYRPAARSLGPMYGIGYTNTNASFLANADEGTSNKQYRANGWGQYVTSGNSATIFLDASNSIVYAQHWRSNNYGGGNIWNVRKLALNWDEYKYAETSQYHGIESTNNAGNFTDSLSINSYNNVTVRLDSNNNNGTSEFRITKNNDSNGTTLMHVREDGNIYSSHGFRINDRVYLTEVQIYSGAQRIFRISNNNSGGTVDIGAADTSWGRFQTDRPNIYMNRPVYSSGGFYVYNTATDPDHQTRLTSGVLQLQNPGGGSTNIVRHTTSYMSVDTTSSSHKVRLYGNNSVYTIGFDSTKRYGYLQDWAITNTMNNESDRGFWWGHTSHTQGQGAMSLTTAGQLYVGNIVNAQQVYSRFGRFWSDDPVQLDANQIGDSVTIRTKNAGDSNTRTGAIVIETGTGGSNSSTNNAGTRESGDLLIATGNGGSGQEEDTSSGGDAGSITIRAGNGGPSDENNGGRGGAINIATGTGGSAPDDRGSGGTLSLTASSRGGGTGQDGSGGSVRINSGTGAGGSDNLDGDIICTMASRNDGATFLIRHNTSNDFRIDDSGFGRFYAGLLVDGTFVNNSDRKYKSNIVTLEERFEDNVLNVIDKLEPKFYDKLNTNDNSVDPEFGFIAQDIEEIKGMDSIVHVEGLESKELDQFRSLSLAYLQFIPINTAGIKELNKENKELKQEVSDLKAELNAIKQALKDKLDIDL